MAQIKYDMLDFWEEQNKVRVNLSKRFYLYIPSAELSSIAPFKLSKSGIDFNCPQHRAERRFLALFEKHIPELKSIGTNNPAVYVHQNGGIPLTGSISFGLIHRGTSIIEVKPQTTCNLDCIYCSVNEGLSSNQTDYLVERSYLVDRFKELATFIGVPVEAHIGVQGEPFLYNEFIDLVADLSQLEYVHQISTDTNCTLLNKPLIDKLATYPKLRLNISLNAVDEDVARKMAGTNYNLKHVMDVIRYAAQKMDILIAPLYVPGFNDDQLPKLVEFVKTLPKNPKHPMLCIQNFCNYKTGRNPTKGISWDDFTKKLRALEKQTGERLVLDFKKDFTITKTKQLPKPFRKGDTVHAVIKARGRYPKTRLAVAKDRVITIVNCDTPIGSEIKLKLLRSKHNIFFGKVI